VNTLPSVSTVPLAMANSPHLGRLAVATMSHFGETFGPTWSACNSARWVLEATMAIAEERLVRSVRAVTPRSREQARRRRNYATLGQVAMCLLTFWGIAILAQLIVGVNIPWVLFGVFTLLGTTLAAVMGLADVNAPDHRPGTAITPLFRLENDEVIRPGTAQSDIPPPHASAA